MRALKKKQIKLRKSYRTVDFNHFSFSTPKQKHLRSSRSKSKPRTRKTSSSQKYQDLKSRYTISYKKISKNIFNDIDIKSRASFEGNRKLVINLRNCRYDIIKQIAVEEFGMIVWNNDPNDKLWDIFWSDVVKFDFTFREAIASN